MVRSPTRRQAGQAWSGSRPNEERCAHGLDVQSYRDDSTSVHSCQGSGGEVCNGTKNEARPLPCAAREESFVSQRGHVDSRGGAPKPTPSHASCGLVDVDMARVYAVAPLRSLFHETASADAEAVCRDPWETN